MKQNYELRKHARIGTLIGLLASACTARQTPQIKHDQVGRATSDSVALALKQGVTWATAESSVINRPKPPVVESRIELPRFAPEKLLGIWVLDLTAPHADIWLDEDGFYAAEADDEGNRPYRILDDSITIYYQHYTARGRIIRATGDTLVLRINDGEDATYLRWREKE